MIDIDKIEAAAKAATPGPWYSSSQFRDDEALFVTTLTPTEDDGTILCRIRNTVSGRPLNDFDYANADHIATANPATVLEIVSMIRERDVVLKQALDACGEVAQWESDGDPAHPASKAIAAIRKVLEP